MLPDTSAMTEAREMVDSPTKTEPAAGSGPG